MKLTHIPAALKYPGMTKAIINGRDIRLLGIWTADEVRKAVEERDARVVSRQDGTREVGG